MPESGGGSFSTQDMGSRQPSMASTPSYPRTSGGQQAGVPLLRSAVLLHQVLAVDTVAAMCSLVQHIWPRAAKPMFPCVLRL